MTTKYPTDRNQYGKPFLLSFSVITDMLRCLASSQFFSDTNHNGLMTFVVTLEQRQFHDLVFIPYDDHRLVVTVNERQEPIELYLVRPSITDQGKSAVLAALVQHESSKLDRTLQDFRGATILSLGEQLLIMHRTALMARKHQFYDHRVATENMAWRYIPLRDRIVLSGPGADIEVMCDRELLGPAGL